VRIVVYGLLTIIVFIHASDVKTVWKKGIVDYDELASVLTFIRKSFRHHSTFVTLIIVFLFYAPIVIVHFIQLSFISTRSEIISVK
jgi:hypothetical protein